MLTNAGQLIVPLITKIINVLFETSSFPNEWRNSFIIPIHKKVTYASMVCNYRPLKEEKYRVRITVGGDRLPYHDDAGSPAADLLETKILINSTISDAKKGARFMCLDIKDHFLATPMDQPEYM